jgi:head-tail adaptor
VKKMATYGDWMPGPRSEILTMCRNWINMMSVAETRTRWGVPTDQFQELGTLFAAAQTLLQKSADEAERTHVITVQVQAAFKALTAKMRFFRDRYFKIPPLTEAEWAALGFREKDTQKTNIPPPEGTPAAALSYPGSPHAVTAHLGPMAGTQELDPRSDYGYAVYLGIMPPGGATLEEAASEKHYLMKPPKDGKGLDHRFTRRRKEKLIFDAEDAGKTVYVCARYENQKGKAGLWGPVVSAIIP